MKIFAISGKAGSGKDYTAALMKSRFEESGKKALVIHYADLLKFLCKMLFGWDGKKDEKGRQLLQYVGTDVVRRKEPDFWVEFIVKILKLFNDNWDYVIIPDCRFPNEIDGLSDFDVVSVRIRRPYYDNGLSAEAQHHVSELALDDYSFDEILVNCGTQKYKETVFAFADKFVKADTSLSEFERHFWEKVERFRTHPKYNQFRETADAFAKANRGSDIDARQKSEDFMSLIIVSSIQDIKAWLDGDAELSWTFID